MASYTVQYMGPMADRLSKLCDLVLVVDGEQLPAHSTTLGQHSPVILDKVVESKEKGKPGKIELVEPFKDKSLLGVLLFLKCCYQPKNVKRFMVESLNEEHSEAPLQDLLTLVHYFQADDLLSECESHSLDIVNRLQPATLPKWVATAERCRCKQLQRLLTERVAKLMIEEQQSVELIKNLITELSPDAAAQIIATAWEGIRAASGLPPPASSTALAEAQVAAATANEAAAAARAAAEAQAAQVAQLTAQLAALQASGTRAPDAAATSSPAPPAGLGGAQPPSHPPPSPVGSWLGPNLQLLAQDGGAFTVEWTVPEFSKLQPSIIESPGFGPDQAWRLRFSPFADGPQSEVVGVFLTFVGVAPAEVKYTVSMVNQKEPMHSRSMEAVSTFVPASNQDTWGTPQFITRAELMDPASGFSLGDKVKIVVKVAPPV